MSRIRINTNYTWAPLEKIDTLNQNFNFLCGERQRVDGIPTWVNAFGFIVASNQLESSYQFVYGNVGKRAL